MHHASNKPATTQNIFNLYLVLQRAVLSLQSICSAHSAVVYAVFHKISIMCLSMFGFREGGGTYPGVL